MEESRHRSFLVFHLLLLLFGVLIFGGYFLFRALRAAGLPVVTCPLHDLLRIYCPLCGGSRALLSLLRFDFKSAFLFHPALLISLPFFLFFYVRVLCVYLSGGTFTLRIGRGWWIFFAILFGGFFLLRNGMLLLGYDPMGDFIPRS